MKLKSCVPLRDCRDLSRNWAHDVRAGLVKIRANRQAVLVVPVTAGAAVRRQTERIVLAVAYTAPSEGKRRRDNQWILFSILSRLSALSR